MKVIRARDIGMCSGVRRAIRTALEIESPRDVTIYGELVHNEEVARELAERGFATCREYDRRRVPSTPKVLIPTHGISERERRRLEDAGKSLIDTTCPLVERVHEAAQLLQKAGFFVIVIGNPDHVEVRGIVEDLEHYHVVSGPEEVGNYDCLRLGIVCQTTAPPDTTRSIVAELRRRNPGKEIEFVPTICRATRDRRGGVIWLLHQVDAVVVVGGKNSNNTQKLAQLVLSRGKPCLHIQKAEGLDPRWFEPFEVVGLTAGTSTLDTTLDEVHQKLVMIPGHQVRFPWAGKRSLGRKTPAIHVERLSRTLIHSPGSGGPSD